MATSLLVQFTAKPDRIKCQMNHVAATSSLKTHFASENFGLDWLVASWSEDLAIASQGILSLGARP